MVHVSRPQAVVKRSAARRQLEDQLEGLGVQLFSHVDGDHFMILGLPLLPLLDILRQHKVVP